MSVTSWARSHQACCKFCLCQYIRDDYVKSLHDYDDCKSIRALGRLQTGATLMIPSKYVKILLITMFTVWVSLGVGSASQGFSKAAPAGNGNSVQGCWFRFTGGIETQEDNCRGSSGPYTNPVGYSKVVLCPHPIEIL